MKKNNKDFSWLLMEELEKQQPSPFTEDEGDIVVRMTESVCLSIQQILEKEPSVSRKILFHVTANIAVAIMKLDKEASNWDERDDYRQTLMLGLIEKKWGILKDLKIEDES